MELELTRSYDPKGANGEVNLLICKTIELPWAKNQRNISCIPEGRYLLSAAYTKKRGLHLVITDVKGRNGILIHPANDAILQLLGCVAPVTVHTGPGRGSQSQKATDLLLAIVLEGMKQKEEVYINIKSKT